VRVLFDQGTPVPLRRAFTAHTVETAYEKDWATLENGELLTAAEQEGFEVLVTTDLNLKYQQNLKDRRIAVVVLSTPSWPRIKPATKAIVGAVEKAIPGSYAEVEIM
jgi:hypothetical protein